MTWDFPVKYDISTVKIYQKYLITHNLHMTSNSAVKLSTVKRPRHTGAVYDGNMLTSERLADGIVAVRLRDPALASSFALYGYTSTQNEELSTGKLRKVRAAYSSDGALLGETRHVWVTSARCFGLLNVFVKVFRIFSNDRVLYVHDSPRHKLELLHAQ